MGAIWYLIFVIVHLLSENNLTFENLDQMSLDVHCTKNIFDSKKDQAAF